MRKLIFFIASLIFISTSIFSSGSKEETTVTLWHCNAGVKGEAFEEIINDFNDSVGKTSGIYIDAIYQGKANDVLTKVKASEGTGTLPDIAQMDATSGMDMNLSKYIFTMEDLDINLDSLLPLAKTGFTSERGLIALPFNASATVLYYNKTLFDSLGIAPPKTMDDMITVSKTLKGKIDYSFAGVPTTSELTTFLGAQNGLSYIVDNENGHLGIPSKVLIEENGSYKAFLEKWKELYSTGTISNITTGVATEFASSRCAMMLSSSSNLSTIISSVDGSFEVGVAPIPMVDEKATGGVSIGGGAMYAFSDSEEVKTVLEYLISEDVQLKWAEKTGYIPLNTNLYNTDRYKAFLSANPEFSVAMEAIINSNPRLTNLWIPSGFQIYYAFQKNIVDTITGALSIDEGVKEMANEIQSVLDAYIKENK